MASRLGPAPRNHLMGPGGPSPSTVQFRNTVSPVVANTSSWGWMIQRSGSGSPAPEAKERGLWIPFLPPLFAHDLPHIFPPSPLPWFLYSATPSASPHYSQVDSLSREVLRTYYVLMLGWEKRSSARHTDVLLGGSSQSGGGDDPENPSAVGNPEDCRTKRRPLSQLGRSPRSLSDMLVSSENEPFPLPPATCCRYFACQQSTGGFHKHPFFYFITRPTK